MRIVTYCTPETEHLEQEWTATALGLGLEPLVLKIQDPPQTRNHLKAQSILDLMNSAPFVYADIDVDLGASFPTAFPEGVWDVGLVQPLSSMQRFSDSLIWINPGATAFLRYWLTRCLTYPNRLPVTSMITAWDSTRGHVKFEDFTEYVNQSTSEVLKEADPALDPEGEILLPPSIQGVDWGGDGKSETMVTLVTLESKSETTVALVSEQTESLDAVTNTTLLTTDEYNAAIISTPAGDTKAENTWPDKGLQPTVTPATPPPAARQNTSHKRNRK